MWLCCIFYNNILTMQNYWCFKYTYRDDDSKGQCFWISKYTLFYSAESCATPGNILIRHTNKTVFLPEDTIEYSCLEGYKTTNNMPTDTTTCGKNGEWSPPPQCRGEFLFFKPSFVFFFSPPVAFLILSVGCRLYIKIFFSLQKSNVLCCCWEMGISLPRRVNTAVELLWNLPVQETTKGWDLPLLSATTLDGLHHHQCAKVILLQYWNSAGKGLAQNINQVVYFNVWREFYCSKLHWKCAVWQWWIWVVSSLTVFQRS